MLFAVSNGICSTTASVAQHLNRFLRTFGARVLSTLGLMMLDSDLNRRHLHHPGRMFLPGMGILHCLLTHEDQQELREKIGFGTLHSSLLPSTSWLAVY
jgi:hypothetical protein